jgi:hypothetical protein
MLMLVLRQFAFSVLLKFACSLGLEIFASCLIREIRG